MVTCTVSMHQGFIPFLYSWCLLQFSRAVKLHFPTEKHTVDVDLLTVVLEGCCQLASKKRLAATSAIPHHLIIRDSTVTVLADAQSTAIVSFRLTFSREEQRCSPKVWTVSCHPLQAWFRGNAVSG